jgi:hypothetical protein
LASAPSREQIPRQRINVIEIRQRGVAKTARLVKLIAAAITLP